MSNKSSGSGVRPNKIYEAFINNNCKVKMLTGTILKENKKERLENIKDIKKWLLKNKPKYCYIESPGEPIIYKGDRDLIRLIHYYDIPISYFYRECYYLSPKIYIFNEKRLSLKNLIKYFYDLIRYYRDIILLNHNVDIMYFPSMKMSEYFNFDNCDVLSPGTEDIETKKGDNLVYVGALSDNYGTEIMLKAVEKANLYKKIRLILVCRKTEFDKYKRMCENYSWLDVYHASGSDELRKIYSKCKIALLPKVKNKYNDFAISVKFFEYISYGLPIIATSCYETDKIINNNEIGLICNPTVDDMSEKIIKLYSDNKLYSKLEKNVKTFSKNNTWTKRIEKIEKDILNGDYYEKIL